MDYITKDEIIIFVAEFNKELDINLLSNYKKIIFSDYELCDNLFDAYSNNNFKKLNQRYSNFNHPINNLP